MSLSSALNAAASGLGVAGTRSEVTARNIANAETPGYVRKVEKVVTGTGGIVSVAQIDRQVDTMLNTLDRAGISSLAAATARADGMSAYTEMLGQPDDEGSPSAYLTKLQTSIVTLSISPESEVAKEAVVGSAKNLANNINRLSTALRDVQNEVETTIKMDVADLNAALQTIADLNRKIGRGDMGLTTADQRDQLDQALDQIAGFMDVQISRDARGYTQIHTSGGTELLVGEHMMAVRYDGATGQLTAGEVNITPGQSNRSFTQGSLAGLFDLRNNTLTGWQADLDTMAAGLVEATGRLAELSPGSNLGLFTDNGQAYNEANRAGLARRIAVNAAVDPDQGGNVHILQNGGIAGVPTGDLTRITALQRAVTEKALIPGTEAAATLTDLINGLVTGQHSARSDAQSLQSRISASVSTISASRSNLQSVDVDEEMQSLMAIQQAYSANAKMISVVSEMLDDLIAAV